MFKWMTRVSVGLAVTVLVAGAASAHHGYSLNYDESNTGTIEGEVQEVFWANPHVHYYIMVPKEGGGQQVWDVETHNLDILGRAGWTRDTIQAGDRLKVTGMMGRNGRARMAGREFQINGGQVFTFR